MALMGSDFLAYESDPFRWESDPMDCESDPLRYWMEMVPAGAVSSVIASGACCVAQ